MVIASLENNMMHTSILGGRYIKWNWPNHQLMSNTSFLQSEQEKKCFDENQLIVMIA